MFENIPYIGTIVIVIACLNILITAVHGILGKIKDATATDADDKAHTIFGKIVGYMQVVTGWLSANTQK